ncbi:MAG TPA: sodium-translocating pyrophosphatase, partial [Cytophagales bacterium]|nr:sodium-translocating pyrophosphatase [Cytophagales bacterium]
VFTPEHMVTGLNFLGLSFVQAGIDEHQKFVEITATMITFGMGASTQALFARVGGGIFTKAADVGADLVGKVEAGIPEDDPRNPATIADNVGDNVGDVAGMGADLYESYAGSILATAALGAALPSLVGQNDFQIKSIIAPMLVSAIGVLLSIAGIYMVRTKESASPKTLLRALLLGTGGSSALILVVLAVMAKADWITWGVFGAAVSGLAAGVIIGQATEYYTSDGYKPTQGIANQSQTGPATVIIEGMAVGMFSTWLPVITIVAGIIAAYGFAGGFHNFAMGVYGIGFASVGMLSTLGVTLATDAFGPIADNAGGNAEMAGLPEEVRERTDALDGLGNTTAATGKGFAIASAALTSLALFAAFVGVAGISSIDIYKAPVLAGLFIGGMIPYIFSSLAIAAVGRAAMDMVNEVRRQFREIPGIMEYKAQPEYEKCVAISTKASLREMIAPGAIALITPVIVGFTFGPEVLGGMLAGITVSGVLMGIFQSNAGGAWDNAKKSFEKGVEIDGITHYKKSEPHKASVTGDTVGDPFKDTSGPSMNILIKLSSIVALIIAPHIAVVKQPSHVSQPELKIEKVEKVSSPAVEQK